MECCRICLSSNNLTSIFGDEKIAGNITSIACVDIAQNDDLPQYICFLCKHELDICVSFKEKCESTYKMLKQQHSKEIEVKEEIILNLLSGGSVLDEKLPERARKCVLDTVKNNVMENMAADSNVYLTDSENMGEEEQGLLGSDEDVIDIKVYQEEAMQLEEESEGHRIYENQQLICIECHLSFQNENLFLSHLEGLHSSTQCRICMFNFPCRSALEEHINEAHNVSSDNTFRCKVCGKAFDLQSDLNSHLCSPIGGQEYKHSSPQTSKNRRKIIYCSNCRTFSSPSQWEDHLCESAIEYPKKKVQPLVCAICHASFVKEKELENHLLRHKNLIKCTKEEIYIFKRKEMDDESFSDKDQLSPDQVFYWLNNRFLQEYATARSLFD